MSLFKTYYLAKFSGRVLYWKLNQGQAELRAKMGKKYELTTSTYQMCILMMFNEKKVISYQELLQNMQIQDGDLKPHLIPLLKFQLIQKNP